MKFLGLVDKFFKSKNDNKKTDVSAGETKATSGPKFPIWLIGGTFGCSIFAFAAIFIVVIGVLIFLGIIKVEDLNSGSGNSGSFGFGYDSSCDYEATTVTVMNLDKTQVLATVSLEDYIIGVACIEVGACDGASSYINENYVKSQYVASKTYVLERGRYDSSTKSITIRSSTADQGWCDLERGCYKVHEEYSDGNTYEVFYPGSESNPPTRSFTEEDLEVFHKWYQDIYGELFITKGYAEKISSLPLANSLGIAYKATTQNFWSWMANQGNMYNTILVGTANPSSYNYTKTVADTATYADKSIYELAVACSVTSGGYAGQGGYPLNGGDAKELNEPITDVLSNDEINVINNAIISAVDRAGPGTGKGVASAATAMMMGLYSEGYYLPYYWGGGHGSSVIGFDNTWGTKTSGSTSTSGKTYYYKSLDCSGFVSWAIRNGACPAFSSVTADLFVDMGEHISFNEVTPGDLFANDGHVILVIKNDGDGVVLTAESTTTGVIFRNYSEVDMSSYSSVDMDEYYNNCGS